ncbi:hypothetical protein QTP88_002044 [Uroleucon formosanum]
MSKLGLSLNKKIKVIEESEKGNSVKSLINTFKCGKTQIDNIIKNKIKIREEWLKGNGKSKRSLKKTVNNEINKAVWDWFVKARSKNIPISGPMLQEKSKDIAIKLRNTDFKGSNGWLECFRKIYNISWNQVTDYFGGQRGSRGPERKLRTRGVVVARGEVRGQRGSGVKGEMRARGKRLGENDGNTFFLWLSLPFKAEKIFQPSTFWVHFGRLEIGSS